MAKSFLSMKHKLIALLFFVVILYPSISNAYVELPYATVSSNTNLVDSNHNGYYEYFDINFDVYLSWNYYGTVYVWVYCYETGQWLPPVLYPVTGSGEGWFLGLVHSRDLSLSAPFSSLHFEVWVCDAYGYPFDTYPDLDDGDTSNDAPIYDCWFEGYNYYCLMVEPPSPAINNAYVETVPSDCLDRDSDGYLDEFGLDIIVGANTGNAVPLAVDAKVICTNTGQSWWTGPWTINNAGDYNGIYLGDTYFNLSGPTALNFKVELWNSNHTVLYQTGLRP